MTGRWWVLLFAADMRGVVLGDVGALMMGAAT